MAHLEDVNGRIATLQDECAEIERAAFKRGTGERDDTPYDVMLEEANEIAVRQREINELMPIARDLQERLNQHKRNDEAMAHATETAGQNRANGVAPPRENSTGSWAMSDFTRHDNDVVDLSLIHI